MEASVQERQELMDTIPFSAAFARGHIDLHGEYDFGEDVLKYALHFDLERMLQFNIPKQV